MNKFFFYLILLLLFNQCLFDNPEEANPCTEKEGEDCKIIFEDNIFYNCELSGQSCGLNGKYETCEEARNLGEATNEQCSKLQHGNEKFCIKGSTGCLEVEKCEDVLYSGVEETVCQSFQVQAYEECVKNSNGCTIRTRSCTETIEYEDGLCEHLSPTNGYKCYYDGAKCDEADSCSNVKGTTLEETELNLLCALFGDQTNDCVPDGNKCKLQSKGGSEGNNEGQEKEGEKEKDTGKENGKDEGKDKENESGKEDGKDDGKDKENEKGKENEGGKDNDKDKENESGKEDGKDDGKDKENEKGKENEGGKEEGKATDKKSSDEAESGNTDGKEKEKETNQESGKEKDQGSNFGGLVSFSFLSLFFILSI